MNKPHTPKVRIDTLLVERGLAPTRTKAQALLLAGQVSVAGEPVTKAGQLVPSDADVTVGLLQKYVSRGGDKLEGALDDFHVDPSGLVWLDVGASTGGCTDCLLQRGARFVHAIDVGTAQLHDALKKDPRVRSSEQTHILEVEGPLDPPPTLCVIDVSFISLKKVLPKVATLLPAGAAILALVKPQFEVGPKNLKKGVVRSDAVREACLDELRQFVSAGGFLYRGASPSRLKGPKGNQEYFFHLTRP